MKFSGKVKTAMLISFFLLFSLLAGIFGTVLWAIGPQLDPVSAAVTIVGLSLGMALLQWAIGPWLIKVTTPMQKISENDSNFGWVYSMVKDLSEKAQLHNIPDVYVVNDPTPNAFAFGRTQKSSSVAVHVGLLKILSKEEVRAVLGHEIAHIKNRDVILITLASALPYMVYYTIIYAGSVLLKDEDGFFSSILVWIGAGIAQALSSLVVLHLSRSREYLADAYSSQLTNPLMMKSALAKISYSFNPNINPNKYAHSRAMYFSDPVENSKLARRIHSNGFMQSVELREAIEQEKKNSGMEFLMSHPLTYKRLESIDENSK